MGKGGAKFGRLDVKRVYFGYVACSLILTDRATSSPASGRDHTPKQVHIAGLKRLQLQVPRTPHEFEVTAERLAVYLSTKHIVHPQGCGNGEDQ